MQLARMILDHRIPHMTGMQPAEQPRADGVDFPITLLTGSFAPELPAQASAPEIHWDR